MVLVTNFIKSDTMSKEKILRLFTHPLIQLVSFAILVFPGQVFDLPYLLILRWTLTTPQLFTITGVVGILLTLASLLWYRKILQLLGLLIMWVSVISFIIQLSAGSKAELLTHLTTLLTLLQFALISLLILKRKFVWKNS